MKFSSLLLLGFWNNIKDEYPKDTYKALRILIRFVISYLCEAGLLVVAVLKSKYQSKLYVENEMRVTVTTSMPNFEALINEKQVHCSP